MHHNIIFYYFCRDNINFKNKHIQTKITGTDQFYLHLVRTWRKNTKWNTEPGIIIVQRNRITIGIFYMNTLTKYVKYRLKITYTWWKHTMKMITKKLLDQLIKDIKYIFSYLLRKMKHVFGRFVYNYLIIFIENYKYSFRIKLYLKYA